MSERALRPGNVAAAAVALGGMLVVLRPAHAVGILQLTLLTVAAGAGLHALLRCVPTAWWTSPFDRASRTDGDDPVMDDLERLAGTMSGRRQPVADGLALPAPTLHTLQPLVEAVLERQGLDPRSETDRDAARHVLSPRALAILTAEPRRLPPWFRMRRPDPEEVARVVHDVLDELEALGAAGPPGRPVHPPRPRTS